MIPVRRWCARRGVSPGSGAVAPDQAERAGPGSAGHRVRDRRRGTMIERESWNARSKP